MNGTLLILVGGAVLAPSLLSGTTPGPVDAATGLVEGDARTVLDGHRSAATMLRKKNILGVPDAGKASTGLSVQNRISDVFASLVVQLGSASATSPGFPKLSAERVDELLRELLEAVKLGVQVANPSQGYVVTRATSAAALTAGLAFDNQSAPLAELLSQATGGVPEGFDEPTDLAKAIGNATREQFRTLADGLVPGGGAFDPVPGCRAAMELAGAMDNQGINFDFPGLGELADSIADSAKALPGRIGSLAANIFGDVLGGILTSTPVLVGIAGYLVYRAVK